MYVQFLFSYCINQNIMLPTTKFHLKYIAANSYSNTCVII